MKKTNCILFISFILIFGIFTTSSCKKKSSDPEPPANPTFVMSSTANPANTNEIIFMFKCTSTDVKLTKVVITDPLAINPTTFDLQGATFLQNSPYYFNTAFTKATGTWTFKFTGNRTSDNSGFISTTTLLVSK